MIDNVVKTFYDGIKKNKLLGLKCSKCGTVTFPPKPTCNKCGNLKLDWITISGKGKLLYYNVENYPGGEFQSIAPYATGLVILEEGCAFMPLVKGVDLNDPWQGNLKLPMDVEAKIVKVGTKDVVAFELVNKK